MIDIIITTNDRPYRFLTTLVSVFCQKIDIQKNLIILDNSKIGMKTYKQIDKMLKVFVDNGWLLQYKRSGIKSISKLKLKAIEMSRNEYIILLDNDILFEKNDTIYKMKYVLDNYNVACVSPLGYDVDDERPVLNTFTDYYDKVSGDANGVSEGNIALGLCLGFKKKYFDQIKKYYCTEIPYLEDQIMVHFFKKKWGYAFIKDQLIYHFPYKEKMNYDFKCNEVEDLLKMKTIKDEEFKSLFELRSHKKDGAEFEKKIEFIGEMNKK